MAIPTQRGNDGPQLQYETYTYDWHRGGTYSQEWRGLNSSKMIAKWLGNVYKAQRATMKIGQSMAELQLEWSGDTTGSGASNSLAVTIDRWEVPEPTTSKDVFTHPYFLAIWSAQGASYGQMMNIVCTIRRYGESSKSAGQSLANENDMLNTLSSYMASIGLSMPVNNEPWLYYYRLYVNGQDHYQTSLYALKHTTNVPNYWDLNVSDIFPNCIYSNPRFLAEVTDPTAWLLPLPGRLQYKLALAYSNLIAVSPVPGNITGQFQVGWLKSASSEATTGRGRIEIQTNYVLDQWSNTLYGSVT